MNYAFKMMAVVSALGVLVLQGCKTLPSNTYSSVNDSSANLMYLRSMNNETLCTKGINLLNASKEMQRRRIDCALYKLKPKLIPKIKEDINKLYRVNSGTGFAVSSDGHIVTNNHVIKSCQKVKVHILGKKYISEILSRDKKMT